MCQIYVYWSARLWEVPVLYIKVQTGTQSLLEEWYNLAGKLLSRSKTLWEQHDFGDELAVRFCHCQGPEQLLQIVWQVWPASITGIHGYKYCHVCWDSYLLPHKLNRNACNINVFTPSSRFRETFLTWKKNSVPVLVTEAYRGRRGTHPLFLNLGTRWEWMVNFMLQPLYLQEKAPRIDWTEGLVDPRDNLAVLGKRKISCSGQNQTPECPAHRLITIQTMLSPHENKNTKWPETMTYIISFPSM